jgi:hypothetical protein
MGVNFPDEETALLELGLLSRHAKGYLEHHLGNSLFVVQLATANGRSDHVLQIVEHIRALKAFGCGGAEERYEDRGDEGKQEKSAGVKFPERYRCWLNHFD